jgi:hypothetical protein
VDRQPKRNDHLGRKWQQRRCEHRRQILRGRTESDTHANIYSDSNSHCNGDTYCHGYGDTYCDSYSYAYAYIYTKAYANA